MSLACEKKTSHHIIPFFVSCTLHQTICLLSSPSSSARYISSFFWFGEGGGVCASFPHRRSLVPYPSALIKVLFFNIILNFFYVETAHIHTSMATAPRMYGLIDPTMVHSFGSDDGSGEDKKARRPKPPPGTLDAFLSGSETDSTPTTPFTVTVSPSVRVAVVDALQATFKTNSNCGALQPTNAV